MCVLSPFPAATRVCGLLLLPGVLMCGGACPADADGPADNNPQTVRRIPRPGVPIPAEREQSLRAQLRALQNKIRQAQQLPADADRALLPDVMIFERAVRCALDYDEFFHAREFDRAAGLLDEGLARAEALLAGEPQWHQKKGLVVRGYISRIDQTVQPYGLWIDTSVAVDRSRPARCDLWFHGRGETLSEVNFLWDRMHNPGRYTPADTVVLHPYGRYSNAFKFAGETDVLEALDDVRRRYAIDDDRISVRGFSMGGAACWQFATHYADRWFAANPGAGFSETPQFLKTFQQETLQPRPWEKALWNLYDCDKYAANLYHCPTIAYSGERDRQKQAADVMEAALREHGIRLRHVIGADMGHSIDDQSREVIDAALASLAERGRRTAPRTVQLETHTLRYHRMHWVQIDSLIEHWKPASVQATLPDPSDAATPFVVQLRLQNVSGITLSVPAGTLTPDQFTALSDAPGHADAVRPMVRLFSRDDYREGESDGTVLLPLNGPLSDGSLSFQAYRRNDGSWTTDPGPQSLRKRHGLQGPIDDAFMDTFVFVRPTGTAAHPAVDQWVDAELTRAVEHWRRHFRGDVQIVDDRAVTDELVDSSHLILWGDPSSNSMIAKLMDRLPVQWDASGLTVGAQQFTAAHHVPVLIYPNPLNPDRYIVLNSSFTFREYAYLNNARQVPMLPDWAVINIETPPGTVWPGEVVTADFFDEQWQLR